MAARASWKGYLKLSLVSCAVALYPASTSSERVSFHNLNRATGNRLKQQMVDSETEEEVDREDRVKGFEFSKGHYVVVEDEDLEKVQIESSHTIEVDRFVPADEIDEVYLDGSHYLTPDDKVAEEAFAVIREAMEQEKVVGLARLVLSRRERIVALQPRGKGILVTTLRFASEVRDDAQYFDPISEVAIDEEMMDLASHIISRKKGHFHPETFEDRYESAVVEMLRAKQQGHEIKAPAEEKPSNVVSLMDALRRSVDGDKPAPDGAKAGKGSAKDAKPTPKASARRPAASGAKRPPAGSPKPRTSRKTASR